MSKWEDDILFAPKPAKTEIIKVPDSKITVIDSNKPVIIKDQALLNDWQNLAFSLTAQVQKSIDNGKAADAKGYAIAAGIATDKTLLMAGRPTNLTLNIHEVRHTLPQLAATLAELAKG